MRVQGQSLSTQVETETPLAGLTESEAIVHIVCRRHTDLALCGRSVPDHPWIEGGPELDCIVCVDLEPFPCPRCRR